MSHDDEWSRPKVSIEIKEDRSSTTLSSQGFLQMRRLLLENVYEDGTRSRVYPYDVVDRRALDAVVIALVSEGPSPMVCIRSSIRPPLVLRGQASVPLPETNASPVLWELPAGLVEPDERGEAGLFACAARETMEETGLAVEAGAFTSLGPSVFLSPGVLAERIHFAMAKVDPSRRGVPTEDGSPTEERALVRFIPLAEALAACDDGRMEDAKSEVALRRLAARLSP